MFAGDSASEFSFNPDHEELSPTELEADRNKTNRTQQDLLTHEITTPEELEFGWSANLSGIRGLTEQQARRILCFERSLKEYLQFKPSEDTREYERNATFGDLQRRVPACHLTGISLTDGPYISSQFNDTNEPMELSPSYCRATEARSHNINSGVLNTTPSLPKYRRLASSRLNKSLRISRSQSSFFNLRNLRRSKSRTSNLTIDSDEFTYLLSKRHVVNSPQKGSESTEILDSRAVEKNKTAYSTAINLETSFRGFMQKISRALVKPNAGPSLKRLELDHTIQEDDGPILYHLSHDMAGAASPYPMRPPLNLNGATYSAPVDGDWIGVSRCVCPKYSR